MRKEIACSILALTCITPAISKPNCQEITPDSISTRLKEVTVEASRARSDTKSSVPAQKIDATEFTSSGITDMGDAMHRMAGVNLRDYGGAGGLKTVSIRGLGAQHTGVVYDGVSLSDMQSGQIDLSRYSLDNINSIQVAIGDSEDIFTPARSAQSASNIFISSVLSPDLLSDKFKIYSKLRVASFRTINPYVRVEKSNGENLAFTATADFTHARNDYPFTIFNGSATTKAHRENSQLNAGHAEANLIWKPGVAHTLQFKGYYYDNARQLPGPVIYYARPSNERLRERNAFGQVSYLGRMADKLSLKVLAKYNWSTSRYKDRDGKYPNGILNDYYIQNEEYLSAVLLYSPLRNLKVSFASDYFHNSLTENKSESEKPKRNSFLESAALSWKIWRLTATGRLLWSMISDETISGGRHFRSRLSPSAALSLRILENADWNLRVSYKDIFRMPTFNELYFDHYGSINLRPELTDQFNLGMTYSLPVSDVLARLEITVDGYMNHIRNKIVAVPYNMFVWTMSNMGKVRSVGCDITLSADISLTDAHHLLLTGNYSYQRSAPRSKDNPSEFNCQLPYTPLNSGAWSLTWTNPWVNLVVHASGCSSRYSTSSNVAETRMAGYMEFGFALYREFRIRASRWDVRADIINAFNRQYEIVRRYPMPGRAFSISIGYKLN